MFSIVAAYTTQTQVDRAQRSETVAESYAGALSALNAEETVELEYLLDPISDNIGRLEEAGRVLTDAVNEIAVQGGREDAVLAKDILALHAQRLVANERLAGASAAGDRTEAERIQENESHPLFLAMKSPDGY